MTITMDFKKTKQKGFQKTWKIKRFKKTQPFSWNALDTSINMYIYSSWADLVVYYESHGYICLWKLTALL